MTNYQRYLRERKEVNSEEEIDEGANLKRQLKRAANVAAGMHASGRDVTSADPTQIIGAKAASALRPGDTSSTITNSSGSLPSNNDSRPTPVQVQSQPDTVKNISPKSIKGNTISQIINSAGGSNPDVVINAVKNALSAAGLNLRDNTFLS